MFHAILLFLFLTTSLWVSGQTVGLVLSGGGSKGVVHIGVLKALEENEIPIDYIAGTSMGAIIGGLYACGYSPREIESIFLSPEFSYWVNGEIQEEYYYHFKASDPDASWFNIKFNLDSVLESSILPANLVSPYQMDFAFMEYFAAASAASNYNFDSLFIPFRCVAADIAENKEFVFREGDIGIAIRASMTFPFYFKPIRVNGKLMFDGGMYNNFPADVVYEDFFPGMIIGSKAASNYPAPKDDDIISQIQTMLMENTEYSVICDNGVLIEPRTPPQNIVDFSNAKTLIDSGYNATIRKIEEIKLLCHSRRSREEVESERTRFWSRKPSIIIDTIYIQGLNSKQAIYIRKVLSKKTTNPTLNDIKTEYFRLLADDKIEHIFPRLQFDNKSGLYNLHLDIQEAKNIILHFGGNVTSDPTNEAFFKVQYNYLGKNSLSVTGSSYIGRFYSAAELGTRWDFSSKIPYYLQFTLSFNQWDYFKTTTYFFEDKTPSFLIENENHFESIIGLPSGRKGKIEAGLATSHINNEYYQSNYFSRNDTADKTYFDFFTPHIKWEIRSLNRKEYSNNGVLFSAELRYVTGLEEYLPGSTSISRKNEKEWHNWLQFRLVYDNYFESIGKLKLGFYTETLLSTQGLFNNYTASILSVPAFKPFPESKTRFLPKFRALNFFSAGLKFVYPIFKNFDFRLEGYVFQPYEEIISGEDEVPLLGQPFEKRYFTGTAAFVFHSPIGPLRISANYYDKNQTYEPYSFNFNFGYLIFNKTALE